MQDKHDKVKALIDFVQNIHPISKAAANYIAESCFVQKTQRGKYLLKPGEYCQNYYFISSGLLRAFTKMEGKEVTTWINLEGSIATSIRSMSKNEPSQEYIQTLDDCEFIVIPYGALDNMYKNFPEMNVVGRVVITAYYGFAEERAFISRIPNAEKRYHFFLENNADIATRVASKYIASYLGMTEETLSRIRRKYKMKSLKSLSHAVSYQ